MARYVFRFTGVLHSKTFQTSICDVSMCAAKVASAPQLLCTFAVQQSILPRATQLWICSSRKLCRYAQSGMSEAQGVMLSGNHTQFRSVLVLQLSGLFMCSNPSPSLICESQFETYLSLHRGTVLFFPLAAFSCCFQMAASVTPTYLMLKLLTFRDSTLALYRVGSFTMIADTISQKLSTPSVSQPNAVSPPECKQARATPL